MRSDNHERRSGTGRGGAGRPGGQDRGRRGRTEAQRGGVRGRGPYSGSRRGGSPAPDREGRPSREDRPSRPARARDQEGRGAQEHDEPPLPEGVEAADLDRAVRSRLRTLSKPNADRVARHLVMAGELIDSDPERAYAHAQAASRRAGRVDVVREAVALTAYALGRYGEALRELRTVRRLSGEDLHRAIEADCERGLGRPERALALAAEAPATMAATDRVELAIVESGARLDLGEPEAALLALEQVDGVGGPAERLRLAEHRATVLDALGRDAEAARLRAALPGAEDEVVFQEIPIEETGDDRAEHHPGADAADPGSPDTQQERP